MSDLYFKREAAKFVLAVSTQSLDESQYQSVADDCQTTLDEYIENRFAGDIANFPDLQKVWVTEAQSSDHETRWKAYAIIIDGLRHFLAANPDPNEVPKRRRKRAFNRKGLTGKTLCPGSGQPPRVERPTCFWRFHYCPECGRRWSYSVSYPGTPVIRRHFVDSE